MTGDTLDAAKDRDKWYDKSVSKKRRGDNLIGTFQWIWNRDNARREEDLLHMRMYANRSILGTSPDDHDQVLDVSSMRLNVIKAVADTATNRIAKTKPKATFVTSGGNHSLRKKAQGMERFVEAVMRDNRVREEVSPRVFLDAAVGGTGCWAVLKKGGKICVERVYVGEILVDSAESFYGSPRNMYRMQYVDRQVLRNLFPDSGAAIDRADKYAVDVQSNYPLHDSTADQVQVITGYHLPSGKEAKDGLVTIAIKGAVLHEEEWKHDWFPFVFQRWTPSQLGFWGNGTAFGLRGIQTEINRLLNTIADSQRRLGVSWILKDKNAKIEDSHLTNINASIVTYTGKEPKVVANNTVAPDWIAQLSWLYERAFEIEGVSQPSATGNLPSGLTSGVAIREWSDSEQGRFALAAQSFEAAHVEIAKRIVALGKELSEENKDFHVVAAKDRYSVESLKWKEVEMPEDSYVIQVFPTSSLPDHPAGRLAAVQEMMNSGLLTPQRGKELLGFPDLDEEFSLDSAARDAIDWAVEQMLDEGKYVSPEPFDDLELAIKVVQMNYNKARQRGDVPDDRLQLLRNYLTSAANMMFKARVEAERAAQMQAMNQVGAPPTNPQVTPGSPLPVNPDGSQPAALTPSDV